jgi:hypothetical protein
MKRLGRDDGQVAIIVAGTMAVLLGFAALALNAGSWIHSQRQLQLSVDAAALAGAQDLPLAGGSVAAADTTAGDALTTNINNNPDTNSGTAQTPTFATSFSDPNCSTSNCLGVADIRPAKGLFANIVSFFLGRSTVNAHAHAQAFLGAPTGLNNISAAAIPLTQACEPPPLGTCTLPDNNVTLNFATGATLLDLGDHADTAAAIQTYCAQSGNPCSNPTSTMTGWLTNGYTGYLPVNQWYPTDNGDHTGLKSAFISDCGHPCKPQLGAPTTVIIPVWNNSATDSKGNVYAYHVVGFAALIITNVNSWNPGTNGEVLTGNLINYIASGITSGPCGASCQNFGVFVVGLDG